MRSTDVLNVQLMSSKTSCRSYIYLLFFYPSFIRKVFNQVNNCAHFLKNTVFRFQTTKHYFRHHLRLGILLIYNFSSENKKWRISTSIFHPGHLFSFFFFFFFFYSDLISLSNTSTFTS